MAKKLRPGTTRIWFGQRRLPTHEGVRMSEHGIMARAAEQIGMESAAAQRALRSEQEAARIVAKCEQEAGIAKLQVQMLETEVQKQAARLVRAGSDQRQAQTLLQALEAEVEARAGAEAEATSVARALAEERAVARVAAEATEAARQIATNESAAIRQYVDGAAAEIEWLKLAEQVGEREAETAATPR